MVDSYIEGVTSIDLHAPEFRKKVEDIRKMGDEDIRASASVSNKLLEKPVASITNGGLTETSTVSKSLLELRHTVEDLDPAHQGDTFSRRKLLGVLPFGTGDRIRDYFDRYQSSQQHLNGIIESLYSGQDELRRDNAAIVGEQQRLWETNGRLRQYLYMAQQLDAGSWSGSRRSRPPIPSVRRRSAGPAVLRPPEGPGPRSRSSRSACRATSPSTSSARTTSS